MKERVEKYLRDEKEIELWNKIFDKFQTDGKEGVISLLKEEIETIKKDFTEYKKKIENNLEVK